MTEKQERPATLTRSKPQPAPDYQVDPVESKPVTPVPRERRVASAKKTAPLQIPAPRLPEPVVPLSTRVSLEVSAILKSVTDTGVTQRAAVEHAIKLAYGKDSKKA